VLAVKTWLALDVPDVDLVRPRRCVACGCASCPVGDRLRLHGHGVRERELNGPLSPGGKPESVTVTGRRYRCTECGAVMLVVPRGVLPRKRYWAQAIALALALWGLAGETATSVRSRVGFGVWFESGWQSLRRWAAEARDGGLFPGLRLAELTEGSTARSVASRVASWLAGHAPPAEERQELVELAFAGAAQVG